MKGKVAQATLSFASQNSPCTTGNLLLPSAIHLARVSNDNAYAESIFKTLKYRPNYQPDGFESIDEARAWVLGFEQWYNLEHHHSGIKAIPHNCRFQISNKIVL